MKMSKRIFCAVLSVAMILCVAGCGKQNTVYLSEYSYYDYEDNDNAASGSTTKSSTNKQDGATGDSAQSGSTGGSTGSGSNTTTTTTGGSTTAEIEAGTGHGSAGDVEIDEDLAEKLKGTTVNVLWWKEYTDEEKAVIEKFEKQTGITVKTQRAQNDEDPYTELINTSVAGKKGYDVVMFNYKNFPQRPLSIMQPLNEISNFNVSDWDANTINAFKIKNNIYGVNIAGSQNSEYVLMYYNETMFKNQGVTTPRALYEAGNWNWDTFLDCAKKMTYSNGGSQVYGYVNLNSQTVTYWTLAGGVDFVSYNNETSQFSSNIGDTTLKSSLEFYYNMAKNKYMDSTYPYGPDEFQKGNAAMFSCLVYHTRKAGSQFKDMTDTLDAVPFPMPAGKQDTVPVDASAFGILTGAKNPEGAIEFLKYFTNPANYDMADSFLNDNMLKTYGDVMGMKTIVSYTRGVIDMGALTTFEAMSQSMQQAGADQVDTSISKYKQNFQLSVDKVNKKINELE